MINCEYILGQLGKGMDSFIAFVIRLPWYLQIIIVLLLILIIFIARERGRY